MNNLDIGNIFGVPLSNGNFVIGQIVGRETDVLNSVTCAFYSKQVDIVQKNENGVSISNEDLISVQFVTPDQIKNKNWKILGNIKVTIPKKFMPYENTRKHGWVGAKVIGSGIMCKFIEAYFGYDYWDQMHDPDYFTKLLIETKPIPKSAKFKEAT